MLLMTIKAIYRFFYDWNDYYVYKHLKKLTKDKYAIKWVKSIYGLKLPEWALHKCKLPEDMLTHALLRINGPDCYFILHTHLWSLYSKALNNKKKVSKLLLHCFSPITVLSFFYNKIIFYSHKNNFYWRYMKCLLAFYKIIIKINWDCNYALTDI